MKLRNFFIWLAAAAVSTAAVSCSDDFDRPPVIVPEATIEANTSILDLKEMYWQGTGSYMTEIGLTENGEHIIIGGRVVTSDECGNVYQRIVIEDETAAIPVRIYATKLYESYHYGQEVRIDVTGLLMGTYNGWLMIGVDYNGGIGGMDASVMTERSQINGLPDAREINEYSVTIPQMNGLNTGDVTEFVTWQSRLVTLENVEFVDAGKQPFGDSSDNSYVTRYIKDADGNRMVVNTSNKCTFKGTTMPTGTGTVRAILSYYRSDWQLVISDPATDCIGFDPMGEPSGPGTPTEPGDAATQLTADFEDGQLPAGWTTVATSGDRTWIMKNFNNNYYAQCSGYNGKVGADGFRSWLITAPVDLDKMAEKVMSFETEIQYGNNEGNMQLYVLNSADPTKAEMVEMTYTQPNPTSDSSTGYVFSGEVDLSQFTGVKYIAWLYTATDPNNSRTYRVDNVKIGYKADQEPAKPDTPVTGNAQFRKVNTITSGKSYILVVDGKVGTAIAQKDSYGRLAMAAPVSTEGDVVTTDVANAIVFTSAGSGYTMTDTYGRFLSMDDSHFTSFQIYTSQMPGSVWNVSFNPDGTAAIVNAINPNCNVVRSGTYTNIAPSDIVQYPEFTAPVLYEKVD